MSILALSLAPPPSFSPSFSSLSFSTFSSSPLNDSISSSLSFCLDGEELEEEVTVLIKLYPKPEGCINSEADFTTATASEKIKEEKRVRDWWFDNEEYDNLNTLKGEDFAIWEKKEQERIHTHTHNFTTHPYLIFYLPRGPSDYPLPHESIPEEEERSMSVYVSEEVGKGGAGEGEVEKQKRRK